MVPFTEKSHVGSRLPFLSWFYLTYFEVIGIVSKNYSPSDLKKKKKICFFIFLEAEILKLGVQQDWFTVKAMKKQRVPGLSLWLVGGSFLPVTSSFYSVLVSDEIRAHPHDLFIT